MAQTKPDAVGIAFEFLLMALFVLGMAAGFAWSYSGLLRILLPIPLVAVAGWLVWRAFASPRQRVIAYQRGVVVRDLRNQDRSIPLEGIRGIGMSAVETYIRQWGLRIHSHTHKTLTVTVSTGEILSLEQEVKRRDKTFEEVRDFLAQAIARSMEATLRRTGEVEWFDGVKITPEELLLPGSYIAGVPQTRVVRPVRIQHAHEDGMYRLFANGELAIEVPMGTTNLHAGLILVEKLWERPRRPSPRAAAAVSR